MRYAKEKPEFELNRLRTELGKARQDEILGGCRPPNYQNTTERQSGFTNC